MFLAKNNSTYRNKRIISIIIGVIGYYNIAIKLHNQIGRYT